MPPVVKNLLDSSPSDEETFRTLLDMPGIRLQQIVSNGCPSAEGFWYDQQHPEWVLLVQGTARLKFEPGGDVDLKAGDFLLIPSRSRHRVEEVSKNAIWLALHFST